MRNLFLNVAALSMMFAAGLLLAQEGELKSILVEDDSRTPVDLDRPDAPEPSVNTIQEPTPDIEALDDFPPQDEQPNPIPGLAPIAAPQPPDSGAAKQPASRAKIIAQPVASPASDRQRPPATMSSIGFSLVPEADVPRVRGVIIDGAAQQSGMKPGDLISAINTTPVKTPADVERALSALDANEFDVAVIRGGRRQSIRVRVPSDSRRTRVRPIPVRRASSQQQARLNNAPGAIAPPVPTPVRAQPDPNISTLPGTPAVQPLPAPYVRRSTQPARPVIGDGGRWIGNGRVINSVRRLFGR